MFIFDSTLFVSFQIQSPSPRLVREQTNVVSVIEVFEEALRTRQHKEHHRQQEKIISLSECNPAGLRISPQIPLRFYLDIGRFGLSYVTLIIAINFSGMSLLPRIRQIRSSFTLSKACSKPFSKSTKSRWSRSLNSDTISIWFGECWFGRRIWSGTQPVFWRSTLQDVPWCVPRCSLIMAGWLHRISDVLIEATEIHEPPTIIFTVPNTGAKCAQYPPWDSNHPLRSQYYLSEASFELHVIAHRKFSPL